MPLAIALYDGCGKISIGSILPCYFIYVAKFEIKILSLIEVIVFTRNGLHTDTYRHGLFLFYIWVQYVLKRIRVQTFFFYNEY